VTRFQVSGRVRASASTRLIVGGVQPLASMTSEAARACSDSFTRARLLGRSSVRPGAARPLTIVGLGQRPIPRP
jgi:hypothetical protein